MAEQRKHRKSVPMSDEEVSRLTKAAALVTLARGRSVPPAKLARELIEQGVQDILDEAA